MVRNSKIVLLVISLLVVVGMFASCAAPPATPAPPAAATTPPAETSVTTPAAAPTPKPTPAPATTPAPTPTPKLTPVPTPTPTPTPQKPIRVVFFGNPDADPVDQLTMGEVSKELGFSYETRDYRFVNNDAVWFDDRGQRRFHIIIFPGGHSEKWFEKEAGSGINENGVENIRKFISKGGSVWAICYSGNSVFAETAVFVGFMGTTQTVTVPGRIVKFYGGDPIFKGTVIGPQESNRPYPRVRFLPIKLNMENPIVKKAKLPEKVYLSTVASPSLIPQSGQSMEVIGWFPSGDAAIAILKYGGGHLYMVPPHVSQTLEIVLNGPDPANYIRRWEEVEYCKQMGVTKEKFNEGKQILIAEGDPDGSGPDRILAKALLRDAANRASALAR